LLEALQHDTHLQVPSLEEEVDIDFSKVEEAL
jgi:hypothetical protein